MNIALKKPRLVFFQWKHDSLPIFLQLHFELHVKCLSEFFEVVVVNEDCDYEVICDTYMPDLTLFESGYKTSISQKTTIKNTSAHPRIPKLGLHNGDPWCDCRVGFISDMAQWGIETFFTISTTTAEHTPEIADNLFVWANFIDHDVFHDYGQNKIIPVLFNGNTSSVYPWRQRIQKLVPKYYPSLSFPHLGYESYSPVMIHGEQYARTLNGSYFVPACGTVAKEIIRKHFEIPGSRSCLITEESPALKSAGFIDMQNCVFADEKNILDKLNHLLHHREKLQEITDNGYKLVHSRHTLKQRDQIFQWYTLNKNLKHDERIVQIDPFQPLQLVKRSSGVKMGHISGSGIHLQLLSRGNAKLMRGAYDEAEELFLKCLNLIPWMSEPKLKLSICNLFKGSVDDAASWILNPIQNNLSIYKALNPDPVEWAYLIRCLICQGNFTAAILRVNQFTGLCHTELERIRWVVRFLQNGNSVSELPVVPVGRESISIHQLPRQEFSSWMQDLYRMFIACKQLLYADQIAPFLTPSFNPSESVTTYVTFNNRQHKFTRMRVSGLMRMNILFERLHVPRRKTGLPSASELDYLIRLSKILKIDIIKNAAIKQWRKFRSNRNANSGSSLIDLDINTFEADIQLLFENENIESVMIISTGKVKEIQEVLSNLRDQTSKAQPDIGLQFHSFISATTAPDLAVMSHEKTLGHRTSKLKNLDLIYIDAKELKVNGSRPEIPDGKFFVIRGINDAFGFQTKVSLLSRGLYTLVTQNLEYAIIKQALKTDYAQNGTCLELNQL